MKLPAPSIVIFDMDGTAVRHVNPRVLHALEILDDASFKMVKFGSWLTRRHAQGPILTPEDERIIKKKLPRRLVHRALHHLRRKEVDQIVQPCPGLYEVLDFLTARNIPLALVSNGLGKGYGHDILEKFDLEKYFRATVFREDIRKSKPNPEPLLLALERMNVPVAANDVIWYIGDRHKDVTAALALRERVPAGVVPIAFGLNASVAVLEKGLAPDHIVMSLFDMLERLRDTN